MASLIEVLIQVLNDESEVYESLLTVSHEKTQVIVKNDIKRLSEIVEIEQDTLTKINGFEKKREEAVTDIASVLGKNTKDVRVKDIVGYLEQQPEVQKQLSMAHDRILSCVGELQAVNKHNQQLVNQALELIEFDINVLQSTVIAPETAGYNRDAYSNGDTLAPVRGGFDTKQ